MATPPLNFQRAVYEGESPAPDQCVYCGRGITNEYFRVGGHMACTACAQQAQSLTPPDAHSVFVHALSYGAIAAIVGCIGYALIVITTGWTIGYAAIGVGYLVGWAMRNAAKQHGGRRYQWAAALLTYAAVAVAFVPIVIHANNKQREERSRVTQSSGTTATGSSATTQTEPTPHQQSSPGRFAFAMLELLGLGLISPFLELTGSFFGGLLNLFIIFIGVRFAWQMMAVKTVSVEGPFEAVTPPSPSTP
jgi:hypothetical protein